MSTEVKRAFGDWYCEPHQDNLWRFLDAGGRRACVVWHRRAGKDDLVLHWTAKAMQQRVGNYWHMLPQAEQARKAIWDAVNPHTGRRRIDEAFPPGGRAKTLENQMLIRMPNGSTWQVVGSDNYNALVGSPPVGIVFSEWALADPQAWAYLRPVLRENDGWAVFIYTPRGKNHGWTLLQSARKTQGWFHEVLPATQSGVFSEQDLQLELGELCTEMGSEHGQAKFEQEYLCSFDAANVGAIYARWVRKLEQEGRVTQVPYDPSLKVHTAWDLGFGDHTVIWFYQVAARTEFRFIDFYANSGKAAEHYALIVLGKQTLKTPDGVVHKLEPEVWALHKHRAQWEYGEHHGPHDAAHKVLAAAGKATGDLLLGAGVDMCVWPAMSQQTQIEAARWLLERSWFDAERCAYGLEALADYHYPWDDKLKRLKDEPLHNWASHPCDAFEVAAQAARPPQSDKKPEKPRFLHETTADEVFWPKGYKPGKPMGERV